MTENRRKLAGNGIHSQIHRYEIGTLTRLRGNPILAPNENIWWERSAVYNPGVVWHKGRFHLADRAVGNYNPYIGRLGQANYHLSKDGNELICEYRSKEPILSPEGLLKKGILEELGLQNKIISLEDPRITTMYLDGQEELWLTVVVIEDPWPPPPIRGREHLPDIGGKWRASTMLTEIYIDDDGRFVFSSNPKDYAIITGETVSAKNVVPFPEIINGNIYFLDRTVPVGAEEDPKVEQKPCITLARYDTKKRKLEEGVSLIGADPDYPWEARKVGGGAPPLRTDEGWLVIYHGVNQANEYRIGVAMLDLEDPINVVWRSANPLLEPVEDYEREGDVPMVVFATGRALVDDILYVFYGAADKRCAVASANLADILSSH